MSQKLEWERFSLDSTILRSPGTDVPRNVWYKRLATMLKEMDGTAEFSVPDNGWRKSPGILAHGVHAQYLGYNFKLWSDVPGDIILMHEAVPRRLIDPMLNAINDYWLNVADTWAKDDARKTRKPKAPK